ncbi:MAG: transglycosylase SLT domain-containing protein [Sterolibacteriaceae bacterium]|uniref:lytic transglycosylase domain-containing protein n=1 Tax=Sulfuritalea sp. TaxID=2480090 RepID=UPI001A446231|nr:transglycosylase SLT domain-containing protein [Sulfuritalea sp.]MBL8477990.1 transglycosylase SLT domain-containing protein [Sterolibacteriaceae bacterium]MBN8474788.1 transglycosylase SLT domain-containing protein [Sulfuritalea sp.]
MKFVARKLYYLLFACLVGVAAAAASAQTPELEAPRALAALEQGLAAEMGVGIRRNAPLAIRLYCDAAITGSAEGFFRIGRILARGPAHLRNPALANAYLAQAVQLGHHGAIDYFDESVPFAPLDGDCSKLEVAPITEPFDLDGYLAGLSPTRRRVADLIRRHAARSGVDVRIALAVAMAESNLDTLAVSPKNAQGVMQLIPGTQERFGVVDAFDPESNIRGGLAYLRWLKSRFDGDWPLVVAAYNAGEGSVDRYQGIPPFRETQAYVRRVLFFAGQASRPGI